MNIFIKIIFLFFIFQFSTVNAQEFLEPEKAFQPEVTVLNKDTFLIHYKIAKNYYLYKDRFQFEIENNKILNIYYPPGKLKNDEIFGQVEVFYNDLPIEIKIERKDSQPLNLTIQATSQGCSEGGICYLPITHSLNVLFPDEKELNENNNNNLINENKKNEIEKNEIEKITTELKSSAFLTNLFFFFLAGLGLSLTPCVLPMIPILSGLIVQQHQQKTKRKNHFLLSLIYVMGMAFTYTLAGIFAGLSGHLISNFLQNAWVLFSFAFIFILLSFSMFDFYELQMPSFIQNKINDEIKNKKGGWIAVFIMGVLSALIVGPCVAAPLAGALMYIGQTGDAFLGGFALFFLALGMGVPLILVGILGASVLPRTGMWMVYIKKIFGVILLGLALWIVHPVLDKQILMFLWSVLFIITSIFLKALDSLSHHAHATERLLKGIGIILFLIGISFLIGALSNAQNYLYPLENLISKNEIRKNKLDFKIVRTEEELDLILKNTTEPILLDFYADWCIVCKEMEKETLVYEEVINEMKKFKLLKIDVTNHSDEDKKILKKFQLFGPPAILFFRNNEEKNRIIGFKNKEEFLKIMRKI